MKLYHVDRFGSINVGQIINLKQNIYFENEFCNKTLNFLFNDYDVIYNYVIGKNYVAYVLKKNKNLGITFD